MKALTDPCARCGGKVPGHHQPYRDAAGKRICVRCAVATDTELGAILTAALERQTTR